LIEAEEVFLIHIVGYKAYVLYAEHLVQLLQNTQDHNNVKNTENVSISSNCRFLNEGDMLKTNSEGII